MNRALQETDRTTKAEELIMSSISFRSSRPDGWTVPRPHRDASLRFRAHGPIQPMTQRSLIARLLGVR